MALTSDEINSLKKFATYLVGLMHSSEDRAWLLNYIEALSDNDWSEANLAMIPEGHSPLRNLVSVSILNAFEILYRQSAERSHSADELKEARFVICLNICRKIGSSCVTFSSSLRVLNVHRSIVESSELSGHALAEATDLPHPTKCVYAEAAAIGGVVFWATAYLPLPVSDQPTPPELQVQDKPLMSNEDLWYTIFNMLALLLMIAIALRAMDPFCDLLERFFGKKEIPEVDLEAAEPPRSTRSISL